MLKIGFADNQIINYTTLFIRVTSLEQLSLAEFSDE
jgi:hypothetical protein